MKWRMDTFTKPNRWGPIEVKEPPMKWREAMKDKAISSQKLIHFREEWLAFVHLHKLHFRVNHKGILQMTQMQHIQHTQTAVAPQSSKKIDPPFPCHSGFPTFLTSIVTDPQVESLTPLALSEHLSALPTQNPGRRSSNNPWSKVEPTWGLSVFGAAHRFWDLQ